MTNERKWSTEQEAIFSWFATGTGSLVVRARAGTGKTTTIIEGVTRAREAWEGGRILLAAFNKVIAQELAKRLADRGAVHVEAKTLHSLGYACIRRHKRSLRITEERPWDLADYGIGCVSDGYGGIPREVRGLVRTLHTRLRETDPHVVQLDRTAAIQRAVDVAVDADVYPDDETIQAGWDVTRVARAALYAVDQAAEPTVEIDFADMIYLPLAWDCTRRDYAMVVVDEAQDMTTSQLELALRCMQEAGRAAIVGDDRQAIYGFRGADSGSLDRLKAELKAEELGLRTTYRCATSVVQAAQRYVPDIVAASEAQAGSVALVRESDFAKDVREGDFVLSRKNAPLVQYALQFFREGRRVHIRGRDLGKTLAAIVRRQKAVNLEHLTDKLDRWVDKERQRCAPLGESGERQLEKVLDLVDFIAEVMKDNEIATVDQLEEAITGLFADDGDEGSVMLATIHKAKGLEAERVFVLQDTFTREGPEETNLRYVAVTRAKNDLRLVSSEAPAAPIVRPS